MADSTTPSLFDAIDSPSKGEEIAGQKEGASIQAEVVTTKVADTPAVEQPQPSFIEPKADLIIGSTGSGKTINIGEVAKYVLLKYGKLTRMASTDPSGAGPLNGEVKAGKIEFWPVHAWPRPIEAMYKSTKGYWPLDVNDPTSPLVEPDAGTFEVYGFGAFEGLTSYGDTILDDLKKNNVTLSQDPSYKWAQGDFSTAGGNQSYYGMMQDTLKLWVINTHLLRYERILWTALEAKGKDQFGNTVAGPMIGGKQATGKAGQWFVNFVHMDMIAGDTRTDPVTKQTLQEVKHILFLKTHIDPLTLVPFPTKVRAPKKYAKDVPFYLESGSLAEAYTLLDKLYEKQMLESTTEMDEVKGLRERLMERAAKARLVEQAAAEKRAKAASLLKPMVTVPVSVVPTPAPTVVGTAPKATGGMAGPVSPTALPIATPAKAVGLPTITIQNVRKSK